MNIGRRDRWRVGQSRFPDTRRINRNRAPLYQQEGSILESDTGTALLFGFAFSEFFLGRFGYRAIERDQAPWNSA
jgi:hypothetical protein